MPDKTRSIGNLVSDNNLFVNPTTDNTGIGTTVPTSKLHVVGNGLFSGIVTASSFAGNFTGTATTSTNVIGGIGSLSSLTVSGVSTLGSVQISSGIVTATTGVVTYYGDGTNLTIPKFVNIAVRSGAAVSFSVTNNNFNVLNRSGGNTSVNITL